MNKEEEYLHEHFGTENPFRVPEDYFEDFAARLMSQLPEQPASSGAQVVPMPSRRWWQNPRRIAVAACLAVVLAGTGIGIAFHSNGSAPMPTAKVQSQNSDSSLEEMADYAMMDAGDFYAYVSDY